MARCRSSTSRNARVPAVLLPAPGGDWNETVIPVGGGSEGFDVTPERQRKPGWPTPGTAPSPSSISPQKRVTATLQANARGANRLKFTPDGTKALVSAGAQLVIFDVATQKEIKRLHLGQPAVEAALSPARRPARLRFIRGDGFVAVIDLKTLEVVGKINAGGNPDGLAWAVQQ